MPKIPFFSSFYSEFYLQGKFLNLKNLAQKSKGDCKILKYFFKPSPGFELEYLSIRVGVSTKPSTKEVYKNFIDR